MKFCKTDSKQCGFIHIILIIWSIFALVYIGLDIRDRLLNTQQAYQTGYQEGKAEIVIKAFQLAESCEPIPLNIYDKQITLIGTKCLPEGTQITKPLLEETN